MLNTGKVPADWRHARFLQFTRKVERGTPATTDRSPCRILESLIKDDLMSHLLREKLITDNQHGFMKGRSCTTNLVAFMDKFTLYRTN